MAWLMTSITILWLAYLSIFARHVVTGVCQTLNSTRGSHKHPRVNDKSLDKTILPGHRRGSSSGSSSSSSISCGGIILASSSCSSFRLHYSNQTNIDNSTFQCTCPLVLVQSSFVLHSTDDGMLLSFVSSDSDFPHGGMVILIAMRLLVLLFLH
jgi:hypothetical protein